MVLYDKNLSSEYIKHRNSFIDTDKRVFEIINSIGIRGKKILDLGCGDGRYSRKFLEMGASHVTGVDVSENMIKLAKSTETTGIEFTQADATKLPFHYETFDFVFSNFVLHHTAKIHLAFEEIFRVLVKNGVLLATLNTYNITSRNVNLAYTEIPIDLKGDSEVVKVTNLIIPDVDLKEIISRLGFGVLVYEYQPNPYAVINPDYPHKSKLEKLTPLVVLKK